MDAYTGARWSELISQRPGLYDRAARRFPIRRPIREAGGQIEEALRPKSKAGRRWIELPFFLAVLYEVLVDNCRYRRVFTGARGAVLRRSNFTRRFWRPAWDGILDHPDPEWRVPILAGFTFHEGRHTQRTWLAADLIPEVARGARLGHKVSGIGDVYEHVTAEMVRRVLETLQARWELSVSQLTAAERRELLMIVPPELREALTQGDFDLGE